MKISIIVPVYNMAGDGKLNYCMDSLVNQNLSDFEIIAVDDASTDESFQILQEYEMKYPGIVHAVHSKINHRQGGAKNLGLSIAQGTWIGFVDSDDWVHPDMYSRMLKLADETGADTVGCQYHLTNEHSMQIGRVIEVHSPEQAGILDTEKKKLWVMRPGSMVIKIYRHDIIQENHLNFPEDVFYEDNCAATLWMLCFHHFELINEPLYYYYQHDTSTVHVIDEKRCYDRMITATMLIDAAKEKGFYDLYKEELEARFIQTYYVNTLFSYMQTVSVPRKKFLKELRNGMIKYFPDFEQNQYYVRTYDKEQKQLVHYHMRNITWFIFYDKSLRIYRRIRYGKKE